MRPLERIGSIKVKLGIVIVLAVAVTAAVSQIGYRFGWPVWLRPLVAVTVALVLVQVVAKGMTSPLREMARAAGAMARGDYDRRVQTTSRDEVGQLARAFNAMAADLGELDRHRRDLIANAAHELRTPLAGLQGTLENLGDGVVEPSPEVLSRLTEQVDRMGRLVHDLLELSRLDAGVTPMRHESVDVGTLVASVVDDIDHEVSVDVTMERGLVVAGDPDRLRQVVSNLLTNAIVHGHAAQVSVAGRRESQSVVLCVADRGPGLDPDDLSQVFERFYRGAGSRAAGRIGSGLGLAITASIVDQHGGTIQAEANVPTGFRVQVHLPTAAARAEGGSR